MPNKRNDFNHFFTQLSKIISAITSINIIKEIKPSLVEGIIFFEFVISFVAKVRDFVMYPLTFLCDFFFDITIPVWIRSYLFLGFLFVSTHNLAHKRVCGMPFLSLSYNPFFCIKRILLGVVFFPTYLLDIYKYYTKTERHSPNVTEYLSLFIRDIAFIVLCFIVINYFLVDFLE